MSSGKFSIDETYINVHLKGGNLHTELLHIEGFFIKGTLIIEIYKGSLKVNLFLLNVHGLIWQKIMIL